MTIEKTRGYWKLEEEVLDRAQWRTRCGRGCGSAVRRTAERMNGMSYVDEMCYSETSKIFAIEKRSKSHKRNTDINSLGYQRFVILLVRLDEIF